jgi:hypothetical protein
MMKLHSLRNVLTKIRPLALSKLLFASLTLSMHCSFHTIVALELSSNQLHVRLMRHKKIRNKNKINILRTVLILKLKRLGSIRIQFLCYYIRSIQVSPASLHRFTVTDVPRNFWVELPAIWS